MLKHFIVTRFNIQFQCYFDNKNKSLICDDNWLKYRFDLFENICLPSVLNQTNQNFLWLIFFDTDTPEKFKSNIYEYVKIYPKLKPIFITGEDQFLAELKKIILNELSEGVSQVITSRIDNDDAIHKDYIKIVQARCKGQHSLFINFDNGFIYDLNKNLLYKTKHASSAFLSRLESPGKGELRTVFEFQHQEVMLRAAVLQINVIPGWLVVVHKNNLLNKPSGKPVLFPNKSLLSFNIRLPDYRFSKLDYFCGLVKFYKVCLKVLINKIIITARTKFRKGVL